MAISRFDKPATFQYKPLDVQSMFAAKAMEAKAKATPIKDVPTYKPLSGALNVMTASGESISLSNKVIDEKLETAYQEDLNTVQSDIDKGDYESAISNMRKANKRYNTEIKPIRKKLKESNAAIEALQDKTLEMENIGSYEDRSVPYLRELLKSEEARKAGLIYTPPTNLPKIKPINYLDYAKKYLNIKETDAAFEDFEELINNPETYIGIDSTGNYLIELGGKGVTSERIHNAFVEMLNDPAVQDDLKTRAEYKALTEHQTDIRNLDEETRKKISKEVINEIAGAGKYGQAAYTRFTSKRKTKDLPKDRRTGGSKTDAGISVIEQGGITEAEVFFPDKDSALNEIDKINQKINEAETNGDTDLAFTLEDEKRELENHLSLMEKQFYESNKETHPEWEDLDENRPIIDESLIKDLVSPHLSDDYISHNTDLAKNAIMKVEDEIEYTERNFRKYASEVLQKIYPDKFKPATFDQAATKYIIENYGADLLKAAGKTGMKLEEMFPILKNVKGSIQDNKKTLIKERATDALNTLTGNVTEYENGRGTNEKTEKIFKKYFEKKDKWDKEKRKRDNAFDEWIEKGGGVTNREYSIGFDKEGTQVQGRIDNFFNRLNVDDYVINFTNKDLPDDLKEYEGSDAEKSMKDYIAENKLKVTFKALVPSSNLSNAAMHIKLQGQGQGSRSYDAYIHPKVDSKSERVERFNDVYNLIAEEMGVTGESLIDQRTLQPITLSNEPTKINKYFQDGYWEGEVFAKNVKERKMPGVQIALESKDSYITNANYLAKLRAEMNEHYPKEYVNEHIKGLLTEIIYRNYNDVTLEEARKLSNADNYEEPLKEINEKRRADGKSELNIEKSFMDNPYSFSSKKEAINVAKIFDKKKRVATKASKSNVKNTLAVKNNNPGNLRPSSGKGFKKFSSPEEGFNALIKQIDLYKTGESSHTEGNETLQELINIYAPSNENDPINYANIVAERLNITSDTLIKDINTKKLAEAIAYVEDKNMHKILQNKNII